MSEVVKELSRSLAETVEALGPSVVRVEGRRRGASSGVVWSGDGVIVTASHVLEWDENLQVGLPDGRSLSAPLVGRDPGTDIAVLRVAASGLKEPAWVEPFDSTVGHLVLGLSRPGRAVRASLGVLSARSDSWRAPSGGRFETYLQTDLGRHIGFSGGLLTNVSGGALAVNTTGVLRGASSAVAVPTLRRVVAILLAHGRMRRGYFGIGTFPVRLPEPIAGTLGQTSGLMLVSVEAESPAGRAGWLLGDVLVALDAHPVRHPGDLQPFLEEERIGADVPARILRAGEIRDARITIGPRER